MADEGIFATTAEVQRKVGENASATANAEAYINQFMAEAESYINAATGVNWSDVYSTINADNKEILKQAASAYSAMMVINYDLSGFPTALEAQTRLDVLDSTFKNAMKILKEKYTQDFINQ